jgi:NAD dependent epimerase/dehydratase family enzyme
MLANLTRWFLGGAAGNGKQYISWIHLADLTQMFLQAIEPENYLAGTYNAVAPNPATNAEFMRALRHNFYRPWCPPVPAWAVKLGSRLTRPNRRSSSMAAAARPNGFWNPVSNTNSRTCAAR